MKLWHDDPPFSRPTPTDREARDARFELWFVAAIIALGLIGLWVSRKG